MIQNQKHNTVYTHRGFSLIEIIAALAIMGIALAGLLRLHISSMAAADRAVALVQATLTAESKLNEILGAGKETFPSLSGTEQVGSIVYDWKAMVQEATPANWPLRKPLQRIDIQVSWGQDHARQQIELSTFKAAETTR